MASRIDIKTEEAPNRAMLVHIRGQLSIDTIYALKTPSTLCLQRHSQSP
jgi:hypothetical protein